MTTIGSLFSGILGLDLGLELCGLGPVRWCAEKDPYARGVIAHHLPDVQIYNDVRRIDERTERVDLICGGFPCQDISVAGKGAGLDGKRSGLWREFARVVRLLRPSFVFVENVSALRKRGLSTVLGDLASLGFDAEWTTVRASDVGAPHIRERLFVLAYADRGELRQLAERIQQRPAKCGQPEPREHGAGDVDDADGDGFEGRDDGTEGADGRAAADRRGGHDGAHVVADAHGGRRLGLGLAEPPGLEGARRSVTHGRSDGGGREHVFPPGPSAIAGWAGAQPAIRRGAHGTARRVDRLRCLGNAVIPQQAALAFRLLVAQGIDSLSQEVA